MIPKAERNLCAWPADLNQGITFWRNLVVDVNSPPGYSDISAGRVSMLHDFSSRSTVASQLVCNDHTRDIPQSL
jgi:hypothetical protein